MEKLIRTIAQRYLELLSSLVLLCMVSFSTNTFAATDTTLFRIKVLQDSVYAGDTIDVEFYIGTGTSNPNILNILNQFQIEVATDTSLIQQDRTTFAFDYPSLASFFGTTISNITTSFTLDPVLGKLNMKGSSSKSGKGDARVGQGKYIVQDNAAGRQSMKYSFTQAISKRLLGLTNPVKVMADSVIVLGKKAVIKPQPKPNPTTSPAHTNAVSRLAPKDVNISSDIKIYPNPTSDYINVDGRNINQYKLLGIDGSTIVSEIKPVPESLHLNISELKTGMYILMLQTEEENWNSYKIVKQ